MGELPHVYVEGRINKCLWCGLPPEFHSAVSFIDTQDDAMIDGVEDDWDISEGRP
jgi:hypothetical protein